MIKSLTLALCLLAAAPAAGQGPQPAAASDSGKKTAPAGKKPAEKASDFDMAKMMAMFDKMFPAQPAPDPARLALAQHTAVGVLPNGTYSAMFSEMMGGLVEQVLSLNPADFETKPAKEKGKVAGSLRDELRKKDPHFDERMRIVRNIVSEELLKLSVVMEPKMREGLARSMARRFDEKQLREINAFIATDSGKAFAGQSMRMWIDPDVMRSMMQSFPHMIAAAPAVIIRLEMETAHLPKPKKESGKDKAKEEDSEAEEDAQANDA